MRDTLQKYPIFIRGCRRPMAQSSVLSRSWIMRDVYLDVKTLRNRFRFLFVLGFGSYKKRDVTVPNGRGISFKHDTHWPFGSRSGFCVRIFSHRKTTHGPPYRQGGDICLEKGSSLGTRCAQSHSSVFDRSGATSPLV
jgi:hypothetical protein